MAVDASCWKSGTLIEFSNTQRVLVNAHVTLFCGQIVRDTLIENLLEATNNNSRNEFSVDPVVFNNACAAYFATECTAHILSLANVLGADSLLPANKFPSLLRDARTLQFAGGIPIAASLALTRALLLRYSNRYGGFMGALRYFAQRIICWIESNPVACRRTSESYVRHPDFQLRCLRFRLFVQCSSLMEDLAVVKGVGERRAMSANLDMVEAVARAYLELKFVKRLLLVEGKATNARIIAGKWQLLGFVSC
jgi:hypothetical protein